MLKIDFKKEMKYLYSPSKKAFGVVDVPATNFLMVSGNGDPNTSPAYQQAVQALYSVAYKIKFSSKKTFERDYTVPPLEGLWWAEDMVAFSGKLDKDAWLWTMMIMQPNWINQEMVNAAINEVRKKDENPALEKLHFDNYHEGLSVQIMHIGSYDSEGPLIADMHAYIEENGYQSNGKHHEIYISDPRRVVPEKLKTVLRQPVK